MKMEFGNTKMKTLKKLSENELFYFWFLEAFGIEKKGVKIENVAKIMAALDDEFKKYPDGVIKHFGEDVTDQAEFEGLSWEEIVDVARDTFNEGFEKIGVTYNSEIEFNLIKNGEAEFKDKFYCRVKLSFKNRTTYYRNHALVNFEIDKYLKNLETGSEKGLPIAK